MAQHPTANENYHGLVDIGSNGIRFSISDLTPPLARIMPTLCQERLGISLYDAQHSGLTLVPIPADTIADIVHAMTRFKHVCRSFGVPEKNIRVVATEATRTAPNSAEFRGALEGATGWKVELLSKEDEGRLGSWGVASSLGEVEGLVMDLGGGSTQLSWIVSRGGDVRMAEKPISLPYGAAALTNRMNECSEENLRLELEGALRAAYELLDLPEDLRGKETTLYLSGGGFRGFGYLLMSQHPINPYPIPIINGFAHTEEAMATLAKEEARADEVAEVFRISKRRATQLPAVRTLVRAVTGVLPRIRTVTFCQGGVREGSLYSRLPQEIRSQDPLVVATLPYKPHSANRFKAVLNESLPPSAPAIIRQLTTACANLTTVFMNVPKESQAACGLRSTTTGIFAGVHGLPHIERAMLALILCERWGGEVHEEEFKRRMAELVGPELDFWCRYVGAVMACIAVVYPSGRIIEGDALLDIVGKTSGKNGIDVTVLFGMMPKTRPKELKQLESVGKKKNCPLGWRKKITVKVL